MDIDAQDAQRLWELSKYSSEELQAELNSRATYNEATGLYELPNGDYIDEDGKLVSKCEAYKRADGGW